MSPTTRFQDAEHPHSGGTVVFTLSAGGTVLLCTETVEELTGRPAEEVRGRRMTDLVTDPGTWSALLTGGARTSRESRTALRHRDGTPVGVWVEVLPLPAGEEARFLVTATPSAAARRREEDRALVRALFTQSRIGLVIHDTELVTTRANLTPRDAGLPGTEGGPSGTERLRLDQVLVREDAAAVEERLRRVMDTGEPLVDWEYRARWRAAPARERVLSMSAFRLHDAHDRVMGVAVVFVDITEQRVVQQRMALLHAASMRLGQTLDVRRNAQELAQVVVPDFADLAVVDLTETVLVGEEPGAFRSGAPLRRVGVAPVGAPWPAELYPLGATIRLRDAESERLRGGRAFFLTDLGTLRSWVGDDPERSRLLLADKATSLMVLPLLARGLVLGTVTLWRLGDRAPFTGNEASLAEEIGSRAALSVDNARRYTRELRTVETLQRSLLPPAGLDLSAAETAGLYVTAGIASGVGGSWYDVIPLSSTRVAFVVGDIAGHGLGATATMGRLRTAVQTLADLDLAPEELLTHLDDLVVRLAGTELPAETAEGGVVGATCLYCVYDPVNGDCVMASAGHPPPVLTETGGRTRFVELKPGPALGVGGMPFEPVELRLEHGSLLALYTDELVAHGRGSVEHRMELLREGMRSAAGSAGSPAEIGRLVLDHALPEPPADDVALLVARVRALPADATASWEFPAEPSVVARAREAVTAKMAAWGLEELAFTTELIASELVTNAIRYAGAPVGLRLIRDKTLICEVSDPSQTQPHLRRARLTDEGGRGLFLVAQLAHRWGSRYTSSGKTIWTEQAPGPGRARRGTGTGPGM